MRLVMKLAVRLSAGPVRWLSLAVALLVALPAAADDAVFPPGSRVGLTPPPGLTLSKGFFGFEDADNKVAVIIGTLPVDAYAELKKSATPDTLQHQGLVVDKREDLTLSIGKAFLITAHQQVDNAPVRKWLLVASTPELTALVNVQMAEQALARYPESAIRASLETLAVRGPISVEEQLGMLPFKLNELAGFHVAAVLPGRAIVLSDSPAAGPASVSGTDARFMIAAAPGNPPASDDRDTFARDVFATIPNISDVHITNSEPLRIGGFQGHEIMASAKDPASGNDVTVVQWLRFGAGGYLHLIGVASAKDWIQAYARFRAVRDGIDKP